MNRIQWSELALCAVILAGNLSAAETRPASPRFTGGAASAGKFCDPVCELRSQDAAFALLVEVYRQHQSFQIESDFQVRLQYIRQAPDPENWVVEANSEILRRIRELIRQLALREREFRMAKMETQVANFHSAYSCLRKVDEDYLGEKVAKNIDPQAAREKIKDLVVLAPGSLGQDGVKAAPSLPASTVLFNPPPGPAVMRDLVEPCE
jgi:hypothetical protein